MAVLRVLVFVALVVALASMAQGKGAKNKKKTEEKQSRGGFLSTVTDKASEVARIATKAASRRREQMKKEASQDPHLLRKFKEGAKLRELLEQARKGYDSGMFGNQIKPGNGNGGSTNDMSDNGNEDSTIDLSDEDVNNVVNEVEEFLEEYGPDEDDMEGSGGGFDDPIEAYVAQALQQVNPETTCAAIVGFLADEEYRMSSNSCEELGNIVAYGVAVVFNMANFAVSMTGWMLGVLPPPPFAGMFGGGSDAGAT